MQLLKSNYSLLILLSSFLVVLFAAGSMWFGEGEMAFVNTNLYLTYGLVIVLGALVLGFSIKEIVRNKKSLITMGIGIGTLLVLFVLSYSGASSSVEELRITVPATPNEVQFVGALTTSTIILVCLGVVILLFCEIRKMVQNG